jgi:hypothetical protein
MHTPADACCAINIKPMLSVFTTVAENVQFPFLIFEFQSNFEAKILGIHDKFNYPQHFKMSSYGDFFQSSS